jgi:hypothetical protein
MTIRRRDFITLLGGAAAWPLAARAQQPGRMRRIGVLMSGAADDPAALGSITAFAQGLQALGRTLGSNVRVECLGWRECAQHIRRDCSLIGNYFPQPAHGAIANATELHLAEAQSILGDAVTMGAKFLTGGNVDAVRATAATAAMQSIPVVFATASDPVLRRSTGTSALPIK